MRCNDTMSNSDGTGCKKGSINKFKFKFWNLENGGLSDFLEFLKFEFLSIFLNFFNFSDNFKLCAIYFDLSH
jgi:hypothetical protein